MTDRQRFVSTVLFCALTPPVHAVTLRVGGDVACDASTLTDAVNTLPEGSPGLVHRIELARNATYSQPIVATRKSIVVIGGYETCSDPSPNPVTPTAIGPTTGTARAIALDGGTTGERYQVTLRNLVISGSFGGGLIVAGRMRAQLLDSVVRDNSAGNGAGVLLNADPSANQEQRTSLILEGDSRLQANIANGGLGGGAYCNGPGEILLQGRDAGVVSNRASSGGGLFLVDGCVLKVDNEFNSATWGISSNTASNFGGGVLAIGSGMEFVSSGAGALLSGNAAQAGSGGGIYASDSQILFDGVSILANRAGADGGGVALFNGSAVFARRFVLNANQATGDGGAAFLDDAQWLRIDDVQPCPVGDCRRISFNTAGASGASTEDGGAIAAENNSVMDLSKVELRGNQAPHSAAISLKSGSSMTLHNSTLGGNTTSELGSLILVSVSTLNIVHSTIRANATSGLQEAIVRVGSDSTVGVHNSILHENFGAVFVRLGGPVVGGSCVIAHEASSSTGTTLAPLVMNPLLTSDSDFRLRPGSPAIDLCASPPGFFATGDDIRSFNRPVDDLAVANGAGSHDAGAFEHLALPPSTIFSNGFE